MAGYYGFTLDVPSSVFRTSVCPHFRLQMITRVSFDSGVVIDFVDSRFGLVNGQVSSIFTELSATEISKISVFGYFTDTK